MGLIPTFIINLVTVGRQSEAGFKNSADSDTNRSSCIRLEGGSVESETRYEILVNSVVNWPNSKVSAEIPS